ncbi:putative reverse transcriptase domain-containing protein [Tanacetum coccineum]
MMGGFEWCADRRRLVRDANTIEVFFKDLIFEFYAVVGSYDDDRRLQEDNNSRQKSVEDNLVGTDNPQPGISGHKLTMVHLTLRILLGPSVRKTERGAVADINEERILILPPRRFKKKSVKRIVEKRVAKAIEEYEKTRADSNNTGGSGSANTGGTVAPDVQGCSYKRFINGKPYSFSGTEGVVGLKRWFKKMEQVFEICKCAEDDKVKFAVCTFESRALTWWNGNVQTLGLANANQIPWSNVKAMMTTEYCPATEIQRMEQELWTLTLKGDDIEAYNNRFHELVLMCPELVSTEKKKIEKYIRGFPEGIKGNVTSSKPATLHDAINMARELIEQGVQAKALRIGDSNKRKWEDQQGNNYHQQQNRRQEAAKVYVAAPAKGRGYAGNLPWCNRCKAHHQPGPCPPRCGKCHKLGHQEGECRTRIPVAGGNSLQNVTCFGCGNHGHYRSDCPELKNRN